MFVNVSDCNSTDESWVWIWTTPATEGSWCLEEAGSMPVVQTRRRKSSKVCCSRDNDEVTVRGWSQSASVTDHIEPCRPHRALQTSRQSLYCIRCGTGNQWIDDHAVHDWCGRTCSVHRGVVQCCSSPLAAGWYRGAPVTVVKTFTTKLLTTVLATSVGRGLT